jgi:hypothetical protein
MPTHSHIHNETTSDIPDTEHHNRTQKTKVRMNAKYPLNRAKEALTGRTLTVSKPMAQSHLVNANRTLRRQACQRALETRSTFRDPCVFPTALGDMVFEGVAALGEIGRRCSRIRYHVNLKATCYMKPAPDRECGGQSGSREF